MNQATLKTVKLTKVRESKTNPRRRFSEAAMKELTTSVLEKGVLVPIMVRPVNGSLEIVAGARRYRAAKAAKLQEIPALIRTLSDEEALEAQVIENLQREDVHPVEEAEGFRRLMKSTKYTADVVAKKVSKSISYVYQRLKLADLSEASKRAFESEKISAGHAILIARLSEKDQASAVGFTASREWHRGSNVDVTVSVRDLGRWIAREIHLSISSAPWKRDDAGLAKAAGPCSTCPKLAGNSPHVFPDIKKKDTCTDRSCYDLKMGAFVRGKKKQLEKQGHKVALIAREYVRKAGILDPSEWQQLKKKAKPCGATRKGIVVFGGDTGHVANVCTDQSCRGKGHSQNFGHHDGGQSSSSSKEAIKAREKVADKGRATEMSRVEVLRKIVKGTKKIGRRELEILAATGDGSPYIPGKPDWLPLMDAPAWQFRIKHFKKMSDEDLAKHLIASALGDQLGSYRDALHLKDVAAYHKVDPAREYRDAAINVSNAREQKNKARRLKCLVASKKRSFDEPTCVDCGCTLSKPCPGGCSWVKINKKTNADKCSACVASKQ
jgi:ParB family chromosome partitioning protein